MEFCVYIKKIGNIIEEVPITTKQQFFQYIINALLQYVFDFSINKTGMIIDVLFSRFPSKNDFDDISIISNFKIPTIISTDDENLFIKQFIEIIIITETYPSSIYISHNFEEIYRELG